ncbi:MAG: protein kinase [Anaerolineae bacterium]|nr:protein kinase [Anaerolineae bacterium]
MKDLAGATLGKYSIVSRLGYGGMATVYRAHQPHLDRYVAIKVLHSHLAEEANFVTRFEREAEAVARLNHTNVVKIYDFDADDGLYFMVMELIQGPTLKAELRARREERRAFTAQEIGKIALPLAQAVGYAHAHDVVHRDLKPSNVMLTDKGRVVLTDFGLAYILGGSQLTATSSTSGTPEYMSPEQVKGERADERSDIYALGVIFYEMAAGRLPFEGETRFATMMAHVTTEPKPPSLFNPDLPPAVEAVILNAMKKDRGERYPSAGEMAAELHKALEQMQVTETPVALLASVPEAAAITESDVLGEGAQAPRPYRGLFAFREEDASFFFGRETFAARLVSAVQESGMVAVIGPSGSGKSSVLFAGLVPHLRQEARWAVVSFRPGRQPFHALADALLPLLDPAVGEVERLVETRRLAASLDEGTLPLSDVVERVLAKESGTERLLLVVDQFEELYTLCPEPEERQRFTAALLEAVTQENGKDASPPFVLALTLRADFMGQALTDRSFAEALQRADVKLGPMTPVELTEAIERPAAQLGVTFEPGLVDRILDDVGDEPGNLPLLEFALTLLWDRRAGRRLTHAAYEAIGRVEGALARYAEKVYARLGEEEKLLAHQVFAQLVQPGHGTEDTRRRASRAELGEHGWALVQRLADERLVVTGQDAAGREIVEVVHEALIRGWRRLQEWMAADREFRSWQERLRGGMRQWKAREQDEAALLRGSLLTEAEKWLAARSAEVSTTEQQFIQASVALREREAARREAQRQRELEAARRLAQEQRRRAEEQAEAAQQLRKRAWILAGVTVVAVVLALLALFFGRQAVHNAEQAEARRQEAEYHQRIAEEQQAEAEEQRQIAEERRAEADRQRQIALSRQLAAQSITLLEDQIDLSLLISLEANTITDTAETRNSMLMGLQQNPRLLTFLRGHPGAVQSMAFSPDGTLMASSSLNGSVRLWTVGESEEGRPVIQPRGDPLQGHDEMEMVNDTVFSPDGTLLATCSDDTTIKLWDTATGELVATLGGDGAYIQTLAFSPDGRLLASVGGDPGVRLWDMATLQQTAVLTGHLAQTWIVAFSPDGETLAAAGGEDVRTILWDMTAEPPQRRAFLEREAPLLGLAFSPDGQFLAVVDRVSTEICLLDPLTGAEIGTIPTDHEGAVGGIAFVAERVLATRGINGEVKFWDIDSGAQVGPQFVGPQAAKPDLVASPDGRLLITSNEDGTISVWDLAGEFGLGSAPFTVYPTYMGDVAFHPDGQAVAVGNYDGTITFFDPATNEQLGAPLLHAMPEVMGVTSLALDPAQSRLLVGRADGTLSAWRLDGSGYEDLLWAHACGDTAISVSPDGLWLASGGVDGRILLWRSATNGNLGSFYGHPGGVTHVLYNPAQFTMVSSDSAGVVRFWQLGQYGRGMRFERAVHEAGVRSLVHSPDGQWMASGDAAGDVVLWRVEDGEAVLQFDAAHAGPVQALAFAEQEQEERLLLLSAGADGRVLRWEVPLDAAGGEITPAVLWEGAGGAAVASAAFAGQSVALGYADGSVAAWDLAGTFDEPLLSDALSDGGAAACLAFDGQWLAAGSTSGAVRLWDLNAAQALDLAPERAPIVAVQEIAYSPDGESLASAGFNGTIVVWDTTTGQMRSAPFVGHRSSIPSLAYSPDGRLIASGSCGHFDAHAECDLGEILLWNAETGQLQARLHGHTSSVIALAFHPDGEILASAGCAIADVGGFCTQGQVLFWDLAIGETLDNSIEAHTRYISSIAFSSDGRILATSGNDMVIMLWDAATGQQIGQRLQGHGGTIDFVTFSPDSTMLASAGSSEYLADGTIQGQVILWNVATGQQVGSPFVPEGGYTTRSLDFDREGRRLVSGSDLGIVVVWDVDVDSWRARACRIANRNMTAQEWTQFFGDEPYRETCGGPAD